MSVFGGDSWAREAQYRKRRVDDLIIDGVEASVYKKLYNGKFACLVCPNNPVLDTATMLSIHMSGSRHRATELKRKDRELAMQEEANKRLALSDSVSTNAATASASTTQPFKTRSKPLIERARKAASEAFSLEVIQQKAKSEMVSLVVPRIEDCGSNANGVGTEAKRNGEVQPFYCRERKERELKYTAAGWKRDGYGRWFKDENVEFDSDDEDPNIVLSSSSSSST